MLKTADIQWDNRFVTILGTRHVKISSVLPGYACGENYAKRQTERRRESKWVREVNQWSNLFNKARG